MRELLEAIRHLRLPVIVPAPARHGPVRTHRASVEVARRQLDHRAEVLGHVGLAMLVASEADDAAAVWRQPRRADQDHASVLHPHLWQREECNNRVWVGGSL